MSQEQEDFIKERVKEVKTVFTVCTGGMVLAETGVLDGLKATCNHEALDMAKEMWPKVEWTRENWVVEEDGKFWTAGGVVVGMDMMGELVMGRCDREVCEFGFKALAWTPRDREGKLRV